MSQHPDRSKVYAREAAKRAQVARGGDDAGTSEEWLAWARSRGVVLSGHEGADPRASNHGGHTPNPSRSRVVPVGSGDVLLRLRRNVAYRAELDGEIAELVRAARAEGVTWALIGKGAGLSRDGAFTRWGRRRPGTP